LGESVLQVQYATPTARKPRDEAHVVGVCAVALTLGFLGANPFAAAVGFDSIGDPRSEFGEVVLHILCGGVVALLAAVATIMLYRGQRDLRRYLSTTAHRPSFAGSVVMMSLGVFCMVVPLLLPYLPFLNTVSVTLMDIVLSMLLFIAGATLLGIGVWGNLTGALVRVATDKATIDVAGSARRT
jgi:hypothetical protein